MQPTEVTVEAALKRGGRLLKWTPLVVIFTGMGLSGFVLPNTGLPGWIIGICFVGSFMAGWLAWSVLVTRWRIWALTHVRNVHELFDIAAAEKLIWPAGSWLERTEIRTAEQRAILEALAVRATIPDVWNDDLDVPTMTELRWSRTEHMVTMIVGLVVVGIGLYMVVNQIAKLWGLAMVAITIVVGGKDVIKLRDRRAQITIDEQGISLVDKARFQWANIVRERVVTKGSGRSSYTALEFQHPEGSVEVKVDQMDLPKKELRHRLRVYRFRSGHFKRFAS
jgi:hypothetical protein